MGHRFTSETGFNQRLRNGSGTLEKLMAQEREPQPLITNYGLQQGHKQTWQRLAGAVLLHFREPRP